MTYKSRGRNDVNGTDQSITTKWWPFPPAHVPSSYIFNYIACVFNNSTFCNAVTSVVCLVLCRHDITSRLWENTSTEIWFLLFYSPGIGVNLHICAWSVFQENLVLCKQKAFYTRTQPCINRKNKEAWSTDISILYTVTEVNKIESKETEIYISDRICTVTTSSCF
jgi:hypothetical protein